MKFHLAPIDRHPSTLSLNPMPPPCLSLPRLIFSSCTHHYPNTSTKFKQRRTFSSLDPIRTLPSSSRHRYLPLSPLLVRPYARLPDSESGPTLPMPPPEPPEPPEAALKEDAKDVRGSAQGSREGAGVTMEGFIDEGRRSGGQDGGLLARGSDSVAVRKDLGRKGTSSDNPSSPFSPSATSILSSSLSSSSSNPPSESIQDSAPSSPAPSNLLASSSSPPSPSPSPSPLHSSQPSSLSEQQQYFRDPLSSFDTSRPALPLSTRLAALSHSTSAHLRSQLERRSAQFWHKADLLAVDAVSKFGLMGKKLNELTGYDRIEKLKEGVIERG
jgi:hypothetical protein